MSGSRRNPSRRTSLSTAAAAWMVGERLARVLDLGSGSGAFAATLSDAGHEVFCVDRDPDTVAQLTERLGSRIHVAGQVESLPYLSCHFDVVTSAQTLHHFAPGLALSEIARVLKPRGHLAVGYTTRDDTVPWVRRLAVIIQRADPTAMIGDYGADSVRALADSPYFGEVERRNFRTWVPITRAELVAMVERRPTTQSLEPAAREELLEEVGEVYDSSARPPEPLLLPYRASCWRAPVDHSGLALDAGDLDGVRIAL